MNVLVEVRPPGGGDWIRTGKVSDRVGGSLSSTPPGAARQVFHFGWLDGEDGRGRRRRRQWTATRRGLLRDTTSLGFERVADLRDGPHELDVHHPKMGPVTVRFTLEAA